MGKLRDRMVQDLELRGLADNTIETYVRCVRKFAEHYRQSPAKMGGEQVREYLLHLRNERRLVASSLGVYGGALAFLLIDPLYPDGGTAEERERVTKLVARAIERALTMRDAIR